MATRTGRRGDPAPGPESSPAAPGHTSSPVAATARACALAQRTPPAPVPGWPANAALGERKCADDFLPNRCPDEPESIQKAFWPPTPGRPATSEPLRARSSPEG